MSQEILTYNEFLEKIKYVDCSGIKLSNSDLMIYKCCQVFNLPNDSVIVKNVPIEELTKFNSLSIYGVYANRIKSSRPRVFLIVDDPVTYEITTGYVIGKVYVNRVIKDLKEFEELEGLIREKYNSVLSNYYPEFFNVNKEYDIASLVGNKKYYLLDNYPNLHSDWSNAYLISKKWMEELIEELKDFEVLAYTKENIPNEILTCLVFIHEYTGIKVVFKHDSVSNTFLDILSGMYSSINYMIEQRVKKLQRYMGVGLYYYNNISQYIVFKNGIDWSITDCSLIEINRIFDTRFGNSIADKNIINKTIRKTKLIPLYEVLKDDKEVKLAIEAFIKFKFKYMKFLTVKDLFAVKLKDKIYIGTGVLNIKATVDIVSTDLTKVIKDSEISLKVLERVFSLNILYEADEPFAIDLEQKLSKIVYNDRFMVPLRLGYSYSKERNMFLEGADTTYLFSKFMDNKYILKYDTERDCKLGAYVYNYTKRSLMNVFTRDFSLSGLFPKLNIYGGFDSGLPLSVECDIFGDVVWELEQNIEE